MPRCKCRRVTNIYKGCTARTRHEVEDFLLCSSFCEYPSNVEDWVIEDDGEITDSCPTCREICEDRSKAVQGSSEPPSVVVRGFGGSNYRGPPSPRPDRQSEDARKLRETLGRPVEIGWESYTGKGKSKAAGWDHDISRTFHKSGRYGQEPGRAMTKYPAQWTNQGRRPSPRNEFERCDARRAPLPEPVFQHRQSEAIRAKQAPPPGMPYYTPVPRQSYEIPQQQAYDIPHRPRPPVPVLAGPLRWQAEPARDWSRSRMLDVPEETRRRSSSSRGYPVFSLSNDSGSGRPRDAQDQESRRNSESKNFKAYDVKKR